MKKWRKPEVLCIRPDEITSMLDAMACQVFCGTFGNCSNFCAPK